MALRVAGARSIFVTHYYKLAASTDKLNRRIEGQSIIVSLTTGAKGTLIGENGKKIEIIKTYVVKRSPPECNSHAIYIVKIMD